MRRKNPPRHTESTAVQMPFIRFLDAYYRGLRRIVAPIHRLHEDEEKARKRGGIRKAMGYQKGTLDVHILKASRGYRGFAAELKDPPEPGYMEYGTGRWVRPKPAGGLSKEQKEWIKYLVGEKWFVCVCDNAAEAEQLFRNYMEEGPIDGKVLIKCHSRILRDLGVAYG